MADRPHPITVGLSLLASAIAVVGLTITIYTRTPQAPARNEPQLTSTERVTAGTGERHHDIPLSPPSPPKPSLSRIDAEIFIQNNRGNIERCLSRLPKRYFFLDIIFSSEDDKALDTDIIPGIEILGNRAFEHPQLLKYGVDSIDSLALWNASWNELRRRRANPEKLSIKAPDVNGCILGSLGSDLRRYSMPARSGFIHRYITDEGGRRRP